MKKGKSRTRCARQNVMRSTTQNARCKARQQTTGYDHHQYDTPQREEG